MRKEEGHPPGRQQHGSARQLTATRGRLPNPLLRDPTVRKHIHLHPMDQVNPDEDTKPTKRFEIYPAKDSPTETSKVYSPAGKYWAAWQTSAWTF